MAQVTLSHLEVTALRYFTNVALEELAAGRRLGVEEALERLEVVLNRAIARAGVNPSSAPAG